MKFLLIGHDNNDNSYVIKINIQYLNNEIFNNLNLNI